MFFNRENCPVVSEIHLGQDFGILRAPLLWSKGKTAQPVHVYD